ncbi:(2Fe-2S)-binding protein [Duganella sp. FT92W]|uniref:(2Fe-2S)-binding protein n=1 Tax=Pseudoduganella rivuli TaxID=2666085 RepID=A0A7X2ILG3_9BURK|nr:(2Fe-2S)-binding protein [Pseudoduganella rivuli]MRV71722.1 (2Fe-2S)-binding protein [Pseudoduganella rivuli]
MINISRPKPGFSSSRFARLAETGRPAVRIVIDGRPAEALAGDTLMVAILNNARQLRASEFGDGKRSGFCLMGACQDCWVWTVDGGRLRACTTVVEEDMHIITQQPEATWPNPA